jgi:hypothetical protein
MKRGDVIVLEEMDEEFQDGWWLGEHPGTGQKGLFPAGMRLRCQHMGFKNREEGVKASHH